MADENGIATDKKHYLKADAAKELADRKVLDEDYSGLLRTLNEARKLVWYEGDDPQLKGSLEDVLIDVENLVEALGPEEEADEKK